MNSSLPHKIRWKRACQVGYGLSLTMAVLMAGGCSSKPEPIHVSGTVTYRGKPVPSGLIVIHPNIEKGNEGERGYAAIKNGQFDTSIDNGKGAIPGAVLFVVGGNDETGRESGVDSKPLFPPYKFEAEVTPTNTTFDIKVPG